MKNAIDVNERSQETELRGRILELVQQYAEQFHKTKPFEPGVTFIPTSAKVYDGDEMRSLVDSSLDFWLTTGRFNTAFEEKLANYLNARYVLTANSGSSANLLAVAALTSSKLRDRALKPGDEVITVAAAFPTTINPLFHYRLVPVFVDIGIPDYNIFPDEIEKAVTKKTRAIVMAHTLGNPFDLGRVMDVAKRHNLWVIEDNCDALGSTYRDQHTATFGHIGTISFYPAHHITMGEGGAVVTNDPMLKKILISFRDWGRDCWCDTGKDNTCGKRFDWQFPKLPRGYDHKFVYSEVGYNLKITDMQAAVGLAQFGKLDGFVEKRKSNFRYLKAKLRPLEKFLHLPEATPESDPSWFGFMMTLRDEYSDWLVGLLKHLAQKKIATRPLFTGNITLQPYCDKLPYRIHGGLNNSNRVMKGGFWVGIYPGITEPMLDYVAASLSEFFAGN